MKDRNRAIAYTRVEGGTIQNHVFNLYEDELETITEKSIIKREVFCKPLNAKIKTRVERIEKIWIHSLFFENGAVYDANTEGFRLRSSKPLKQEEAV